MLFELSWKYDIRPRQMSEAISGRSLYSFIHSGDLYSATSRHYYSEALRAQSRPKKKDLREMCPPWLELVCTTSPWHHIPILHGTISIIFNVQSINWQSLQTKSHSDYTIHWITLVNCQLSGKTSWGLEETQIQHQLYIPHKSTTSRATFVLNINCFENSKPCNRAQSPKQEPT